MSVTPGPIVGEEGRSEWWPIETAPKDGSRVLTFSPNGESCGYRAVDINYFKRDVWQCTNERAWPPTHWMPLPLPPPQGRP